MKKLLTYFAMAPTGWLAAELILMLCLVPLSAWSEELPKPKVEKPEKVIKGKDGWTESTYGDGTIVRHKPGDSITVEKPDDSNVYWPDGLRNYKVHKGSGPTTQLHPEKPIVTTQGKDGSKVHIYTDGNTAKFNPNGGVEVIEKGPGNTVRTFRGEGLTPEEQAKQAKEKAEKDQAEAKKAKEEAQKQAKEDLKKDLQPNKSSLDDLIKDIEKDLWPKEKPEEKPQEKPKEKPESGSKCESGDH